MAGWKIEEHLPVEVREVLLAARDAGYLVKDVAAAAGIEPNKMARVGTGKRDGLT